MALFGSAVHVYVNIAEVDDDFFERRLVDVKRLGEVIFAVSVLVEERYAFLARHVVCAYAHENAGAGEDNGNDYKDYRGGFHCFSIAPFRAIKPSRALSAA